MRIGIDDTDSPRAMCTTYLGAVLFRRLQTRGFEVGQARLVRLNPNVPFKTRGNAAIALEVQGDPGIAFQEACRIVEELADLEAEETHPGVVVSPEALPPALYEQAVKDFVSLEEAIGLLEEYGALYRGYKNKRGLIGATAAVCSYFPDATFEWLSYRYEHRWGTPRTVDQESLFLSESVTRPHTWDTVDPGNDLVVGVPHTPDPVLFGIRGESPFWVARARNLVLSEEPALEQMFFTNQGTDAHIQAGEIGALREGRSYRVVGQVADRPQTGKGGHVSFLLAGDGGEIRCMAYEPTRGFRHTVRALRRGDRLVAVGSYKLGSINLEKMQVVSLAPDLITKPPLCTACNRRMTRAGRDKGYKCRTCPQKSMVPESRELPRTLEPEWYEVPSSARRHLAKPLIRMGMEGIRSDKPVFTHSSDPGRGIVLPSR